jgi:uncharacterized protein YbjT (DUF2867 family)
MRIGVSGASGHLGRAVVPAGPAQGRFGDYNRPESLAEAYAGLDRLLIISTVDQEPGKRGAQNVAAIDAAVRAGVKHIVFMSAAGTRQEEEPAYDVISAIASTSNVGRTSAAALSVINNAVAQPPTNTNSPRIGSNNLAASVNS